MIPFLLILWRNITHKQGKKGFFLLPVNQLGRVGPSCSLIHSSPLIQQIPSGFWVCSVFTNSAMKRRTHITPSVITVPVASAPGKHSNKVKWFLKECYFSLIWKASTTQLFVLDRVLTVPFFVVACLDSCVPCNGMVNGRHPAVIFQTIIHPCVSILMWTIFVCQLVYFSNSKSIF